VASASSGAEGLPAPTISAHRRVDGKNSDRQNFALCLALFVAVCVCYSSITHNTFLTYDDDVYVTRNAHVMEGMKWETVKWAFTTFDGANWHPVTWLSHELDVSVFGVKPTGPHWENVVLHAVNAVVLFLLLQSATGFRWRSLMVAALFGLHPINVESVAWVAERKNVLSTLFFLLALYAYDLYTKDQNARQPERRRYVWVVGLYALALLTKPQVITFPFLLVLWDYWPLRRVGAGRISENEAAWKTIADLRKMPARQLLWEKWPLLLLSALSALVTMLAQQAGGAVKDLAHYPVSLRLENTVMAYVRYLKMAIWPSRLVALYPHPTKLFPAWQVAAGTALLVVITVAVLRARKQGYLAVGWFWFLGSMVPMIGLVQVGEQALADRYAYISFIGLFVMVVWLVADLAQAGAVKWTGLNARAAVGLEQSDDGQSESGQSDDGQIVGYARAGNWLAGRWLAIPAVCCLLAFGIFTYRQVGYWHDSESFFRRTIALTDRNFMAHKGLAAFLYSEGKNKEAIAHVRTALAIRPEDAPGNFILGDYERNGGNVQGAIDRYRLAAEQARGAVLRSRAYGSLGYLYRETKQPIKAKQSFEKALEAVPDQPILMVQLGLIAQLDENDTAEAVREFDRAMALQPTDVGLILLANALLEEGKTSLGNEVLERAEKISKDLPAAEEQAKSLLADQGASGPAATKE
jgi:tetratricopeptide (TPR) repeat protein